MRIQHSIWAIFFLSVTVWHQIRPRSTAKEECGAAFVDIPDVHIIFDDLLIAAHDEAEHDVIFRTVLERARRYNARFNRDKLQFKVKKVKYVGLQIAADGIRPDPDKVSAIVNMATPTDVKAIQRFLGTVTYLSKFIPNFSTITEPSRALIKSGMP